METVLVLALLPSQQPVLLWLLEVISDVLLYALNHIVSVFSHQHRLLFKRCDFIAELFLLGHDLLWQLALELVE